MAETLISPGVLARENDQSFIGSRPVTFGGAVIGPAIQGPVGIPTPVSSYSQYEAIFGGAIESGSQYYTYLNTVSARNYFEQGGESLLVTRVVSGSFTAANTSGSATSQEANLSIDASTGTRTSFKLDTLSQGEIMNSYQAADSAGGTLDLGSTNNLRWEIAGSNGSSGQFSLLIRRGNDTTNQKAVLETYNNLSLDPTAENYISKMIGDIFFTVDVDGTDYYVKENGNYPNRSAYVRVSDVFLPTPQYFDNNGTAKVAFTGSLPKIGSGSFAKATGKNDYGSALFNENISATNIQGIGPNDYTQSIKLLGNKDAYQFNVLTAPGLIKSLHSAQTNLVVSQAQNRTDCIAVIDLVPTGSTIGTVTSQASSYDTSYAAAYWPWVQSVDGGTGQIVWSPASTFIPGVYAFTDASSDPWFAPAGITRGGMGQVVRAERKLTSTNRDTLYEANINPIATFPQQGVVVFGQKTLQKAATALDRINVRRLLITLKGYISQIADNLVFEQNTIATRQNFLTQVNPYLESVQQRQGLFAFKVVMDENNNTPDVIDRNELIGQIFLQPTRTAEFILLDFNVLPTGATFPS